MFNEKIETHPKNQKKLLDLEIEKINKKIKDLNTQKDELEIRSDELGWECSGGNE